MKTLVRWIFKLLISVLLIAIIVPVAATFLIKQDDIKHTLSDIVMEQTGRQLHVDGSLGFVPGLQLKLFANDLRYDNAAWGSVPSALTAKRIELTISLVELLQKQVTLEKVELFQPQITIEQLNDDLFNLIDASKLTGGEPEPLAIPDWLKQTEVVIHDGQLVNLHPKRDWEVDIDLATIRALGDDQVIEVDFDGSLEQLPLTLNGTLGTLSTWLGRKPSIAALNVALDSGDTLTANGTIDDVLQWTGLDLQLAGEVKQLRDISRLFLSKPLDLKDIVGKVRLLQPETVRTMQLTDIDGWFSLYGVRMQVAGRVGEVSKLEDIQVAISAKQSVDLSAFEINLPPQVKPKAEFAAVLTGESDNLQMNLISSFVSLAETRISAKGIIDNVTGDWEQSLRVHLEIDDLTKLGLALEKEWPSIGQFMADGEVIRRDGNYLFDNVQSTSSNIVQIRGAGSVVDVGVNQKTKFTFSAETTDAFLKLNEYTLPVELDSFSAEGEVVLIQGVSSLRLEKMTGVAGEVEVTGNAQITDLSQADAIRLSFQGRIKSLKNLGQQFAVNLPEWGAVNFSGALIGKGEGRWDLAEILAITDRDNQEIKVTGGIRHLGKDRQAEFRVAGNMPITTVIEALPETINLEPYREILAQLTPINATASIVTAGDDQWALKDLDARSEWLGTTLKVTGGFSQLADIKGLVDVHLLGTFSESPKLLEQFKLPAASAVDIRLELPIDAGLTGIQNISGRIEGDGIAFDLAGEYLQLSPLSGDALTITVALDDVNLVLPLESALQPNNALRASAVVDFSDQNIIADGEIQLGDNALDVKFHWQTGDGDQPGVGDLNIASERLDLTELLIKAEPSAVVFDDSDLVPAFLFDLSGAVKAEFGWFKNYAFEINDLTINAQTKQEIFSMQLEGGASPTRLKGDIVVAKSGVNNIDISIDNLPVQSILALSKGGMFQGGDIDAKVKLAGKGSSLGALMAQGDGKIKLAITDSNIDNSTLDTVGGDIVTNFLALLNPLRKHKDLIEVECGAINLTIKDGVASTIDGLAMKTSKVTLLGSGDINFPRESMKILIAPKARKGLGISASSVVKLVRIGGTLSKPKAETDPTGILKSIASTWAAIASGGGTLLVQGLYDRVRANSDVCAIARGEVQMKKLNTLDPSRKPESR